MKYEGPGWREAVLWVLLVALITVVLLLLRNQLDKAHMALAYLLLVLFGSSRSGRPIGIVLALLCFLSFNFFLLPPHYTFLVRDPLDWLVLLSFLLTAVVGAELLYRAQRQARAAEERAEEIKRLSALREHVEALRQADRLKDALMAAVSHDLRTPLTTIKALGHEMLKDGDERAAIVVEEADRLNRVVSDLLDLSRLNSGGIPLRLELNPADDLITAAIQQTSGVLGTHELKVTLPPDEFLAGQFDAVHAVRALTNLIQNAAQYSPPDAAIELTLLRVSDRLRILIEDRGPGIPDAQLARVFEPFARLPGSRDEAGAGLGLSIAQALARAQGGDVRYERREGGGSRFVLELPAVELPLMDEELPGKAAPDAVG